MLVNLDPTIGSEIRKTRPCVVISPDEMNRPLNTVIIAPITSKSKKYPTRVAVRHGGISGWVVLDQIRTIDKKRIVKLLGTLNLKEIFATKEVLRNMLVD